MKHLLVSQFSCVSGAMLLTSSAFAQAREVPVPEAPVAAPAAVVAPPPAPLEPPENHDATRLRFDILSSMSASWGARGSDSVGSVGLLGVTLDIGAQIGDHAAVYARVEGTTSLVFNQGAVYLIGEWTPLPRLSLGTGVGLDGFVNIFPTGFGGAGGVSVPLIVGLNLGHIDPARTRHKFFRIDVELAAGGDPSNGTFCGHALLGFGGAWK